MNRIDIGSAKLAVVFPEGKLPAIDPNDPSFVLALGGFEIAGKLSTVLVAVAPLKAALRHGRERPPDGLSTVLVAVAPLKHSHDRSE